MDSSETPERLRASRLGESMWSLEGRATGELLHARDQRSDFPSSPPPGQFPARPLEALVREDSSYPKGNATRSRREKGTLPAAALFKGVRRPSPGIPLVVTLQPDNPRSEQASPQKPPAVFSLRPRQNTCCNPRIHLTCSDCCRSPQLKRQRLRGARFIYPSPLAGSTFTPLLPPCGGV